MRLGSNRLGIYIPFFLQPFFIGLQELSIRTSQAKLAEQNATYEHALIHSYCDVMHHYARLINSGR